MITLEKLKIISRSSGNDICIVDKDQAYTWEEVITLTESRIVFLKRMFNEEQLRSVSYLSKNSVDIICWLAAFSSLGIPANGLDYSLPVGTIINLLKKINPGILLVSFSLYTPSELNQLNATRAILLAVDAPTDSVIDSIGVFHQTDLCSLLQSHKPAAFRSVSLTSGTSSIPKIALRYHSFDGRRFTWFTERYGFNRNDSFMLILPLYHAAGNGWARMFMSLGATLYLVDQDDHSAIRNALYQKELKATVMTPNLVARVTNIIRDSSIKPHFRWVLVGGSNFSVRDKLAAISVLGPVIYEYYGCTESGVNILAEPEDMRFFPESVGKAFEGNQILILNKYNQPVGTGEKGRVAISSYMLMDEYADGSRPFNYIEGVKYFLMADYGYLDKSGRLFLMNRNGDQHNKYNIYRIESNIRMLPCINDVAVIFFQKNINCVFSTSLNDDNGINNIVDKIKRIISSENIVNFRICVVDEIPYSPSGKVRFSEVIRMLKAA